MGRAVSSASVVSLRIVVTTSFRHPEVPTMNRRLTRTEVGIFSVFLVTTVLSCGGRTAGVSGHSASGASGSRSGGTAGDGGRSGTAGSAGVTTGAGGSAEGGAGGLPHSADCDAWIALPADDPGKTAETDIVGTCGHAGIACPENQVCCVGLCTIISGKCFPENNAHNIVDCFAPDCVHPSYCYPGGIVTPQ